MLGLPMRDALVQMDFGMAADIAWANLDRPGMWLIAIAVAIAVWATLWLRSARAES